MKSRMWSCSNIFFKLSVVPNSELRSFLFRSEITDYFFTCFMITMLENFVVFMHTDRISLIIPQTHKVSVHVAAE